MTGAVFVETLRRYWRQTLWWGLGIGALGLSVALIVPNSDMLREYSQIIQSMPPSMLQLFGGEDATTVATPAGFLDLMFFSYALLILAAYAVIAGLNVTANEEESKVLDLLLSTPVPRWRLILEKFLAYAVITVGIVVLTFACTWAGLKLTPTLTVDQGRLLETTLNLLPSALLVLALTILLTAVVRRRNVAAAIAGAVVVGSYFIDSLGRQASASFASTVRFISFYAYYDSGTVIRAGLNWGNVLVLLAVTIVLVAGGIWFFQRRNIGL